MRAPSRERRFWLALTLVIVFLFINKQFDLQTLLTDAGRVGAKLHGWYTQRHKYQAFFIFAMAVASIIAVMIVLRRARRASGPVRGAMVGLALLLLFVLVRASSFQKIDLFINQRLGSLRANHVMELGGIALVTAFALAAAKPGGKRRSL